MTEKIENEKSSKIGLTFKIEFEDGSSPKYINNVTNVEYYQDKQSGIMHIVFETEDSHGFYYVIDEISGFCVAPFDLSEEATLTKENATTGMKISNKQHPEWGTWKLDVENETIKGYSGERMLYESEYRFWKIISE